jgi:hypothetical protein
MQFEGLTVVTIRLYGFQKCDTMGFSSWVTRFERNLLCPTSILKMEVEVSLKH